MILGVCVCYVPGICNIYYLAHTRGSINKNKRPKKELVYPIMPYKIPIYSNLLPSTPHVLPASSLFTEYKFHNHLDHSIEWLGRKHCSIQWFLRVPRF